MDFKNFIDILATPQNLGLNKWVLNNFSDLKSSNDYLHIIRLRYDNRWLRVYWDGKLKEVEKDYNFYLSTPIKNKVPVLPVTQSNGFYSINSGVFSNFDFIGNNIDSMPLKTKLSGLFMKNLKSQFEGGELKTNFYVSDRTIFLTNPYNKFKVDDVFTEYRFIKNFYNKNVLKTTTNLDSLSDLWALNRNNNTSRVYPNINRVLLSGNLLIGSKESEGAFNTNLVSVKDPA